MFKQVSNLTKGSLYTLLALVVPSIMAFVLHVSAQTYMLVPLISVVWWMLILKISLSFIYYTVTYSVGEEIGWRGYLLPKLMGLGRRNALLLTGCIHAIFHFPLLTAAVVLGGIINRRENIIQ